MKIMQYKKQALLLALLLIQALFILLMILHYGVNTPFWDDWEMVPLFQKVDHGTLTFHDLWAQHNEHRILFPNIVLLVSAYITHWDQRAELVISFMFSLVSVLFLYRMLRVRFHNTVSTIIAVAALGVWFYSPIQWQNWLWGWQVEWFMCVAGVIGAIYFLDCLGRAREYQLWLFIAAIASAIVATFSLASGILVWVVGLGLLVVQKQGIKKIGVWGSFALVSALLYYHHYQKPTVSPPLTTFLHRPGDFVQYFLVLVGKPVGGTIDTSMLMGAIFIFLLAPVAYFIWIQRKQIHTFLPWLALMAFSLMADFVTAVSRVGFGIGQSTNSRYTAITLLFVIGLTLTISTAVDNAKAAYKYKVGIWLCIAAVSLPLVFFSYQLGIASFKGRSAQLKAAEVCTHEANPDNACLKLTYPNPNIVRGRLAYLKQKHWAGY